MFAEKRLKGGRYLSTYVKFLISKTMSDGLEPLFREDQGLKWLSKVFLAGLNSRIGS